MCWTLPLWAERPSTVKRNSVLLSRGVVAPYRGVNKAEPSGVPDGFALIEMIGIMVPCAHALPSEMKRSSNGRPFASRPNCAWTLSSVHVRRLLSAPQLIMGAGRTHLDGRAP